MSEEKIGIKLADGRFYPILDARDPKKRRVILTTASNDQERAQIDLYRGHDTPENYVGSVILEDLAPAGEEREIELLIGLDEEGTVSARATESSTGTYQSLSVSLDSVTEEDRLELPDFDEDLDLDTDFDDDLERELETGLDDQDLEAEFGEDLGLDDSFESQPVEETTGDEDIFGDEEELVDQRPARRFSPVALAVFLILSLAVLAALTYGVFKLLESDPVPPLEAALPLMLIRKPKRKGAA